MWITNEDNQTNCLTAHTLTVLSVWNNHEKCRCKSRQNYAIGYFYDMFRLTITLPCRHIGYYHSQPMSVAARSGLRVRNPPAVWMSVPYECRVLSCTGLCDGPITRPEESYRVSLRYPKFAKFYINNYIYIYICISQLKCVQRAVHIAEPSVTIDTL